jgi:oleate hydratase
MNRAREDLRAYLVGGGIASLAAAVYLIRDGGVPGRNITIVEESPRLGGSLDAGGSPEHGYSMRGSRMYGAAYTLMYELLSGTPSLDDPHRSVTRDTLDFWETAPWEAKARLVEDGKIVDTSSFGLREKDQADLIGLMLRDEAALGAKRIDECFDEAFFRTNFWFMWSSMFGFGTWHSAVELRRYFLRFLRLFPDLASLRLIQSTRYNGYDSIVKPMARWLEAQGVVFEVGARVTDLEFSGSGDRKAVRRISCLHEGRPSAFDVRENDVVIVTLGSMTAESSWGSMTTAPVLNRGRHDGAWALWERLAEKDPAFGRPRTFCGNIDLTKWVTFTVTHSDGRFFRRMEAFSANPPGCGGLVTLKTSSWLLTFHLYHPPAYAEAPEGTFVWWGYGLFPDRIGDFVQKKMSACIGEEILVEVFSHLGFQDDLGALVRGARCIPCMLPYTTSQFMPRAAGDRPQVVPAGVVNLAFVGQYCEIPDDVVYTVEYSVHSALLAVTSLLGLEAKLPPTYRGLDHPKALVGAIRTILR